MPVQLNFIFATSTATVNSQDAESNAPPPANQITIESENYKKRSDVPLIDVAVATICFGVLVSLALLIDANMQADDDDDENDDNDKSQMIALTLIIAFLLVSIFVCIYATYRMGVCLWTGPLESSEESGHQLEGEIDLQPECPYILDLPPSYKSITDELPPSYNSIVNNFKLKNNYATENDGIINHM